MRASSRGPRSARAASSLPAMATALALLLVLALQVAGGGAQDDGVGAAERPRAARTASQDADRLLRTYLAKIAHDLELAGRPRLGKRNQWWLARPATGVALPAAPAQALAPSAAAPAPALGAFAPALLPALGPGQTPAHARAAQAVYDLLYQFNE